MAADFPTTLVTIQRVLPGDRQDAPGKEGDLLHNQICDELEALQAKVGIDGSAVATSIDKRLADVEDAAIGAQTTADDATDTAETALSVVLASPQRTKSANSGNAQWFDILKPGVLTDWNADYSAGITVSLDTNVLFEGLPTIRCDVAAGTSGFKNLCGVATAIAQIPYQWDRTRTTLAIRTTNPALFSSMGMFVGDSTYANYWSITIRTSGAYYGSTNYPQANEWYYVRQDGAAAVGAGSPATAARMRAKVTGTLVSQAQTESIWFGFVGIVNKRRKPTLILTADDGTADHYTWMRPALLHYDLPMSFGIVGNRVGTSTYMTSAQIQEMDAHPSGLFDFTNHSYTHPSYNAIGAAAAYADIAQNRAYMLGIGLQEIGANIVFYPSGEFDDDLIKLLMAGGFHAGRGVVSDLLLTHDQLWGRNDKGRFGPGAVDYTDSTRTVANVIAAIDANTAANTCGAIMMHKVAAADGSYQWSYDKANELFERIAVKRDAGEFDCVSYSRHIADIFHLPCAKR